MYKTKLNIPALVVLLVLPLFAQAEELTARFLVVAEKHARVSSQMNGRISKINVGIGKAFKRKDKLIEFDCAKQVAELAKSKATVTLTSKTLEAQKEMYKLDAISDLDVQMAQADYDRSIAEMQIAQSVVSDCKIVAPYDGRVADIVIKEFENVSYGDPLMEIVQTKPLRLDLLLPSQWISWLKPGMEFSVVIDETGRNYKAIVTGMGSLVDSVSQTVKVVAQISSPDDQLLPGMSGTASFVKPGG